VSGISLAIIAAMHKIAPDLPYEARERTFSGEGMNGSLQ
jgi:hypothetical protein